MMTDVVRKIGPVEVSAGPCSRVFFHDGGETFHQLVISYGQHGGFWVAMINIDATGGPVEMQQAETPSRATENDLYNAVYEVFRKTSENWVQSYRDALLVAISAEVQGYVASSWHFNRNKTN